MNRRRIITGSLALIAAPSIVRAWQVPGGASQKLYFEFTLTHSFVAGFDAGIAGFGIAGASASLAAAGDWGSSASQIAEAEICGSIHNSQGAGSAIGYPTKWVGINSGALNRVYACAVHRSVKLIWFRDVTGAGAWKGNGTGTQDPATDQNGFDYSGVIAASIYAFGGVTHNNFLGNYGEGVLNFGATAFVGAIPSGYRAWGAAETLNSADKSANITLSGGDLTFSSNGAPDLNNIGQLVRSVGSFA